MTCTRLPRTLKGRLDPAIHPEVQDCSEEDKEIAAFQKRKGFKSTDKKKNSNPTTKTNFKGYSSNYRTGFRPGNSANWNRKYCFYCKLQNHTQDDCFKRIRDKKPCKDKQGCAYWPRVYLPATVIYTIRDSSQFFIKEPNDTPHSGSKRHSTINSQFMYHFNRNLQ